MGAWKNHVFDLYEQIADELTDEGMSDDQIWLVAEQRAHDRLADMADRLRDRDKEERE